LVLDILRYDYDTKIRGEKPLRVSEQVVNYSFIEPYGLRLKGVSYLALADINRVWQEDQSSWKLLVILLAIFLVVYAILEFSGLLDRLKKWYERMQDEH
jgi:hypothetical protein